jgi:hypothetical protein
VLVSAYILEPRLFADKTFDVLLDPRLMTAGFIQPGFAGAPTAPIITPEIKDAQLFCDRCYELWHRAIK